MTEPLPTAISANFDRRLELIRRAASQFPFTRDRERTIPSSPHQTMYRLPAPEAAILAPSNKAPSPIVPAVLQFPPPDSVRSRTIVRSVQTTWTLPEPSQAIPALSFPSLVTRPEPLRFWGVDQVFALFVYLVKKRSPPPLG